MGPPHRRFYLLCLVCQKVCQPTQANLSLHLSNASQSERNPIKPSFHPLPQPNSHSPNYLKLIRHERFYRSLASCLWTENPVTATFGQQLGRLKLFWSPGLGDLWGTRITLLCTEARPSRPRTQEDVQSCSEYRTAGFALRWAA